MQLQEERDKVGAHAHTHTREREREREGGQLPAAHVSHTHLHSVTYARTQAVLENEKLKYQVMHLKRAVREGDEKLRAK